MTEQPATAHDKFPPAMRALHWLRAAVVIGTLGAGALMVNLPDDLTAKFELLYPNHKQFGMLALLLGLLQALLRWRAQAQGRLPATPASLPMWQAALARLVHRSLYLLLVVVPLMGYAMSSSFTQSDGVPFFFVGQLPELLPKNDEAFAVFQLLHRVLAYTLLALLVLHVAGAIHHRRADRGGDSDVLRRML